MFGSAIWIKQIALFVCINRIKGKVNTEELFLTKLGKESVNTKVKVTSLKATQNQLVGKKVSLFLNQLQNGDPDSDFTKALLEPIIVSSDGHMNSLVHGAWTH